MAEELKIEAKVENLDRVRDFVNALLEERGCGDRELMSIDLALEELFVNIASYAYAPDTGMAVIRVSFPEEKTVSITLTDTGREYNPLAKEDPDITLPASERAIGGLGIYMVKKSMDEVTYEYKDSENRLTFVKHF